MASNEDILQFSNFKHGYITDGADFPKESVQDCANLDFEENRIARRKPYHFQEDLSAIVPSGYTIIGLHSKIFTDGAALEKEVLVMVVKKTTTPWNVRIYVSDWFYPTSAYGNSKDGTRGWTGLWTELTKQYTKTPTSVSTSGDTGQKIIISGDTELQGLDANDLRGWYVSEAGVIIGQITTYVPNNDGDSEIYYARGQEVVASASEPKAYLKLMSASGAEVVISRFPVILHNTTFFAGSQTLEECTFSEFPNGLRITCGTEGRVLWFGFLTDKQFFGTAADVNTGDYLFTADWDGFWLDYDVADVLNKDVIYDVSTADGANPIPTGGATVTISIKEVKKETGVTTTTSRESLPDDKYITFYNKADYLELGIILTPKMRFYQIIDDNSTEAVVLSWWKNQMFGLLMEIDGSQALYLKHFFGTRQCNSAAAPDTRHLCNIDPGVVFNPDFNRRYSALMQFYGKGDEDVVNPFQYTRDFTNFAVYNLPEDRYGRAEHNSVKHTLVSSVYYKLPISAGDGFEQFGQNTFQRTDQRVGLSLKSYLNMDFWKDVIIKAKKIIKIGEDNLAIHLSDDSVSTDTLQDKRGAFKVAISNIQNTGGSNAASVYSDERVRQITLGEKLITGESIVGRQFLLFTSRDCYYYEFPDNVKAIPLKHMKFENAGTYSSRTLIKAQYAGQYAGIYWIGKRGIYRFLDNKPENITENRWEKEFELYTDAEKALAVMGFLPRTMDIFVIMPKYVSVGVYTYKIFLWNIKQQNWRKYTYTDRPIAMVNSADEEMWFLSGTNGNYLFKTATPAEAAAKGYDTRNATPTKVDVVIMLEKMFTHGSRKTYKTFSRVEMAYKHNESDGQVKYTARGNGSSTNDLLVWQKAIDESRAGYGIDTIDITAGYTDGTQVKARKAVNWYNLKIETIGDNTTPGFGEFVIDEIIVAGEQRMRTSNR